MKSSPAVLWGISSRAAWLIAFCVAMAGCQPATHPAGSGTSDASSGPSAQTLTPGFYRKQSDASVFKIDATHVACLVANPEQMDAYGGFGKVHVLDDASDLPGTPRDKIERCSWPMGLYHFKGSFDVYRVDRPDVVCKLKSGAGVPKVREIPEDSKLTASKASVRTCR
jgi:hypothetical protein